MRKDGQACNRRCVGIRQMQKWVISIVFNEEALAKPGITVGRIQTATAAILFYNRETNYGNKILIIFKIYYRT